MNIPSFKILKCDHKQNFKCLTKVKVIVAENSNIQSVTFTSILTCRITNEIWLPSGPLHVGHMVSFVRQLWQTMCPLWHCIIGGRA